jgi:hypothetical protein
MPPTNHPTDDPNDPRAADEPAPRVTEDGITEVGFDDPELRPLPPDKLHYHVPHPDPHPEMHEHSDVPIKPLVLALASIVGVCLLSFVMLYFLFWSYYWQQRNAEKPRTAVPLVRSVVPEPRLQGVPGFSNNHPTKDLLELRRQYNAELDRYGRSPDGAAVIPIDRAMGLALEKGLFPVQAAQGAGQGGNPGGPTTAPKTQPSSQPSSQRSPQPQRPAAQQGPGGQR